MRDVIVVGGSAGGVEALRALVGGLPHDLPAAVLAVVHIPPRAQSGLPALLGAAGPLRCKAAENAEPMDKGVVYVAPPDRHLLVERGRLRLTKGPRDNRVRPSVDSLFRSAAVDLGPRVIGVVLSGAQDDGTAGLWAVKDRGGVAMVQQPDDAVFPDMPESALANVAVDYVLPAAAMGPKLAALAAEPAPQAAPVPAAMAAETEMVLGSDVRGVQVLELGAISANACPECHGALVEIHEGSIVRFRCHTGHAYSLRTLLADTESAVERSLWNAVRAIEERSFLLRTLEQKASAQGDAELAARLEAGAAHAEADAKRLRELTVAGRFDQRRA